MCTDCNDLTIPVGPQGPKGDTGEPGNNGTNGTNGTNGVNGTNAFKFIKQFTTTDIEQQLTITREELNTCGNLPVGCLGNSTTSNILTDLHIKVYKQLINGWAEMVQRPIGSSILADSTTYTLILTTTANPDNDIYIQLDNSLGTYRVVILG